MTTPEMNAETVIAEHSRHFEVRDPLLDTFAVDKQKGGIDGIMADIFASPLGRRALDITQLSKAEQHVTIPGTDRFTRLGHIAAIAEMIQRIAHRENIGDEQTLAYVLRAAPSDLAHGPFSHATDIAVQGPGSNETFHEQRVPEAFELGGINEVFERHNIQVNERGEIEGVPIPDWVESSAPDVCVDRLQYTLNELLLWFDGSPTNEAGEIRQQLKDIASLDSIIIGDDGSMIFTDIDQARLLAKGYLLLSTEHWNDPVNRVQLYLLIESLKYSILNRRLPGMDKMDNGKTRQPYDYLYATDTDVLDAMASEPGRTDPYLFAIEGQLADIGREEQRRFTQFKRPVYEQFLTDPKAVEYPSAILHPGIADFGPESSRFEIELLKERLQTPQGSHPQVPQLDGENGGLYYLLYPLKNRRIDPLVRINGVTARLSEHDHKYSQLLDQHQIIQQSSLRVHIPTTTAYKELLGQQANQISGQFFAAQENNQPMHQDPKRRGIETAADRALAQAIMRGHYVDLR